jgi:hypothetical protein
MSSKFHIQKPRELLPRMHITLSSPSLWKGAGVRKFDHMETIDWYAFDQLRIRSEETFE